MNTVAEEMQKTRTDVAPGDANFRSAVNVGGLSERIAAAHARLRQQTARLVPDGEYDSANVTMTRGVEQPQADEARILTHDLGVSNCAASVRFFRRFLALEEEVRTTTQMFRSILTSRAVSVSATAAPSAWYDARGKNPQPDREVG